MKIFSARLGLSFSIVRRALIGLWIQEAVPEAKSWLFDDSSQERTSSVIDVLYSSTQYSTTCLVSGELIVTVLLSAPTVEAPWAQRTAVQLFSESVDFWLIPIPIRFPFSLSVGPALSRS